LSLYRIYVLNAQDRIARSIEALFPTDRAALAGARNAQADFYAAEVWDGERLVGRLGGEFSLASSWEMALGRGIISGY
jgi:hypothetical protein